MQECDLHYQHTDLHSSEQSIITTTTKSFLEPRIYDLAVKNEGFLNILEDKHSTIKKNDVVQDKCTNLNKGKRLKIGISKTLS
jgi:hypothetical protein